MGPIDSLRIFIQWEKIKSSWSDSTMLSVQQLLKSKTFWTLVGTATFNLIQNTVPLVQDPHLVTIINAILSILAIIFRMHNAAGSK